MDKLLPLIEAFLIRHKMSPTHFGRACLGDANVVTQLRGGRVLRSVTRARVRRFMRAAERRRTLKIKRRARR